MVDQNGKLFGKINLIDLIIILVLLALVATVAVRVMRESVSMWVEPQSALMLQPFGWSLISSRSIGKRQKMSLTVRVAAPLEQSIMFCVLLQSKKVRAGWPL